MEYKIDLHSHSIISQDGGITADEYATLLSERIVDMIAVTDHNRIDFALSLQKSLGQRIIVGEEIMTSQGEIIGLFLTEAIAPNQLAEETAKQIHAQGGLVYIPHPFEWRRKGLGEGTLKKLVGSIDIIEVFNGRSFQNRTSKKAMAFAKRHAVAPAASSDAHSFLGVGSAYTVVGEKPMRDNLVSLLNEGRLSQRRAPFLSLFAPTLNRIKRAAMHFYGK